MQDGLLYEASVFVCGQCAGAYKHNVIVEIKVPIYMGAYFMLVTIILILQYYNIMLQSA